METTRPSIEKQIDPQYDYARARLDDSPLKILRDRVPLGPLRREDVPSEEVVTE